MAGWMLDEAARVSEIQVCQRVHTAAGAVAGGLGYYGVAGCTSRDRCPLWMVSALSGAYANSLEPPPATLDHAPMA